MVIAWVFFRADSLSSALSILSTMADPTHIVFGRDEIARTLLIAAYAVLVWLAPNTQEIMGYDHDTRHVGDTLAAPRIRPILLYGGATVLALGVLGIQQNSEFIYFRF